MKSRNAILSFIGGLMLGIFLALSFGASGQNQAPALPGVPVRDWSHVTVFASPTGVLGVFDQTTGRLYMYDRNWENCILIRELTVLGSPTRPVR